MLVNRFLNSVLLPAAIFVVMDNYNGLVENYVRTNTREDKRQMLSNPEGGGSIFDFIISKWCRQTFI